MTNYHLQPPQDPQGKPAWQEKKEQRKKQLAEVRHRRWMIYERYKARLAASKQ